MRWYIYLRIFMFAMQPSFPVTNSSTLRREYFQSVGIEAHAEGRKEQKKQTHIKKATSHSLEIKLNYPMCNAITHDTQNERGVKKKEENL